MTEFELRLKSIAYRRTILRIIHQAQAGHMGGSLSCVDVLNVLYNRVLRLTPESFSQPERDHYIHSKGHAVEALYTVLADRGFFPESDLDTLCRYQSHYIGHPTRKVHGIEHNTGGLGHGLSVAVGLALAARRDGRAARVFVLLGDGELAEGSNWEAAMTAAHYGLDNLTVIVDRNRLQISGGTESMNALEPLAEKFAAFNFAVRRCDGNDIASLLHSFDQLPFSPGKPSAILADTVKGKGVSFVENRVEWHHHVPNDAEYALAVAELAQAEASLRESAAHESC